MYAIMTIEDIIRVPPTKLGAKIEDAVKESVVESYRNVTDQRLGIVLAVVSVDEIKEGKILPGDAGVHYRAVFKVLTYKPELQELVFGEVIENTEFGAFIRVGPVDGLIHISQLMDDFVSFDKKNLVFSGKQTKHTLKEKDLVRARIISSSFGKGENKIGLTMRQSGLGSLTWIEEEKKKSKPKEK